MERKPEERHFSDLLGEPMAFFEGGRLYEPQTKDERKTVAELLVLNMLWFDF